MADTDILQEESDPTWYALSASAALQDIKKLGTGISTITTTLGTIITIHKTALEILSILTTDLLNPQALAIKTAISTAQSLINKYIKEGARVHILVVPAQRKKLYNLETDFQMETLDKEFSFDETVPESVRKKFEQAMLRVSQYDQGNEGFARVLYETINDEDDIHRPDYGDKSAIFGAIILVGAQDLLKAYELMRWLQSVFGVALKGNPLIPTTVIKTPQNLKQKLVTAEDTKRIAVRLSWENPPTIQSLAEFDGVRVRITELLIIRSINPNILKAKTWADIFGPGEPVPLGKEDRVKEDVYNSLDNKTSVIRAYKYDGVRDVYLDDDDLLTKDTTFYYALAYRYEMATVPEDNSDIEWEQQKLLQISNVIQVRVKDKSLAKTKNAVEPNWYATPNILSTIPSVEYFLKRISAYVESWASLSSGAASSLTSYINFLKAEATRYTDFATDINNQISKLSGLFSVPATGVYVTTFSATSGGTDALVREFMQRLTDTDDTSAPPFHGSGITAGLVFVAGAPNASELSTFQTLFNLLFGTGGATQTAYQEAVATIDKVVAQAETLEFGEDMEEGTAPTEVTSYATFNESMEGTDPSDPETFL